MTDSIEAAVFEVRRDALSETRVARHTLDLDAERAAGRAVLAIDHFALTANNITYAAFGDAMSYWQFFPAADGFGRIPVWGFADVVASPAANLPVGTRLYGYFPMASHLTVTPARISDARVFDGAEHRQALPPVYNAYDRVPPSSLDSEARQALLKPLVVTSFLIADFLDDNALFGADQVVVSSASSKTSIGLGQCLKRLKPGLPTIGLTSARNRDFVTHVDAFSRVVAYDDIAALDSAVKTVFVDMAGSADIIQRVHGHFRDCLVYSCRVGATHWEDKAGRLDVPGAKPVFFFAPSQIEKRRKEWGPAGFDQRLGSSVRDLVASSRWLEVEHHRGPAAVGEAYQRTLSGTIAPDRGLVLSMRA